MEEAIPNKECRQDHGGAEDVEIGEFIVVDKLFGCTSELKYY